MSEFLVAISGWGDHAGAEVVGWVVFALSIVLVLLSIGLVVSVLMQSAKDHKLSGAIAGGAAHHRFFGIRCNRDCAVRADQLVYAGVKSQAVKRRPRKACEVFFSFS